MSTYRAGRGPRTLGDVLGDLFAERGYARLQAVGELEAAWIAAVGDAIAGQSQLGGVRRGVLQVTVTHPALLDELASFRKAQILATFRHELPHTPIRDIRFRVGRVDLPGPPPTARPRPQGGPTPE